MVMKKCKICGKEFDAKSNRACYCSDDCKKEGRKRKGYDSNKWHRENKLGVKIANKKWNENNKELRKELNKKWNENNKEDRKAFNNDINAEKLEKQRAYCSAYGGYFDNNKWHPDSDRGRVKESLEERKEKLKSKWGALYE